MDQPSKKKNTWKRIARIVLKTALFIFLFFILVILLVLTPPVQNFIRKKAVSYLENKLQTRVEIGRIYIGLPKKIILEDFYIEDRQKDTLLAGSSARVNMAILKLIFKNEIDIHSVQLENITAKIKRSLPDTAFNFQFIADAFSPTKKDTSTVIDTSASSLVINSVTMDKARLVYKDIVSGSDIETWIEHFDTRVHKIDPQKLEYDIPTINLSGTTARIYQSKPLEAPDIPDSLVRPGAAPLPKFSVGQLNLEQVDLDYRNDVSAIYTTASIGTIKLKPDNLDFNEQVLSFASLVLENTKAAVRVGKKEAARELVKEVKQTADSSLKMGWQFELNSLVATNNDLRFDDDNQPHASTGIDYAHLHASPFTLEVKDFKFSQDSVSGTVEKAAFKEQSGFELTALSAKFLYAPDQSYIHDLFLQTPGTELKRDLAIRYASFESLQQDIGNMELEADIENSRILVKDVLAFVPQLRSQPAFADPSATWYVNSRVSGTVDQLKIYALQVQGLRDTRIDISGEIAGLPDMNAYSADLTIRNISSSQRDINLFLPPGILPSNITLPPSFTVRGVLKGNTSNLIARLNAMTGLGDLSVNGQFRNLADPQKAGYDAVIETRAIDIGTILQDRKNLGRVTARVLAKGTGFDPATASADWRGTVQSIVLNQYDYRDLQFGIVHQREQTRLTASMNDQNIDFDLEADGNFLAAQPTANFSVMVDSVKMQALHFTTDPIVYRGKIQGEFSSFHPDDLVGKTLLTQTLLVHNEQRLQLDTVEITASRTDSGHSLILGSDIAYVKLAGNYKLTELGAVFQQSIQPYFNITPVSTTAAVSPYAFTLNASIVNTLPLKALIPALENSDSMHLESRFSNAGWNASLSAPAIDYAGTRIRGLTAKAGTDGDSIRADILVDQITNPALNLYTTSLKANLANNVIDFTLDTKDRAGKTRYNFSALFRQPRAGEYHFSFDPSATDGVILNYERWSVPAGNQIAFSSTNVTAKNFVLSKSGQQISINSVTNAANSPLQARFDNFRLATLTAFVQDDSTLVNGTLNGSITFSNILQDPVFDGTLNVADLSVKNDTVGNAVIRLTNSTQDTYVANITLSGRGNDVRIDGRYFARGNGNSTMDLDMNIVKLPLTTVEAFSAGAIRDGSGAINGQFKVNGTLQKPRVNGQLNFDQAAFRIRQLNSYFRIDQEKISVDESGIRFDRFSIRDSLNNPLTLDGVASTTNFVNYKFDFTIRATDFQALNSTKKDNNIFYGQLFFNTNLHVGGTESNPAVDGRLTVNEKTKMTIVLPQREPGIVEREGIIEFVDMNAPLNDSLFLAPYDSLNTTGLLGMDISVNVEVNKLAEFNLIIDEGNGDFLNVRGEASLSAGVDPSGKLTLAGSYELEEGSYELSFNFIRRKFDIKKGSKIIWLGEPTNADVNITATYIANVAPLDLVKNQMGENVTATQRNTYLEKIPFDIVLHMEGKLLKPDIRFDILLPEDKNYDVSGEILTTVRTKLEQLRQEPGELNKQVFAVILLNRFIGENPFNSSSETIDPSTLARQSVSKLLTEQLNRLAGDLVEGVDLNFDIVSSEDYTSGQRRDRTDLNVGLSKKLLSDRLSVSVGSNFELQGAQNSSQRANNIAGNVALNYKVSSDGRYLLRAYRKNEYEGIIDGYIIETGVSFIISVDYNRFRQIFLSKEQRERRKENRRKERIQRRQRANQVIQEEKQP
jgi:translocation and assembly module TamB